MNNTLEQQMIFTCADLLEQNTKFHSLSIAITVVAALVSMTLVIIDAGSLLLLLLFPLIILLGVAETVMAARVSFDAALLRRLVLVNTEVKVGLEQLDEALVKLKLMPMHKTGRELDVRLKACMDLFKTQIILCACQIIAVVCFGAIYSINTQS